MPYLLTKTVLFLWCFFVGIVNFVFVPHICYYTSSRKKGEGKGMTSLGSNGRLFCLIDIFVEQQRNWETAAARNKFNKLEWPCVVRDVDKAARSHQRQSLHVLIICVFSNLLATRNTGLFFQPAIENAKIFGIRAGALKRCPSKSA